MGFFTIGEFLLRPLIFDSMDVPIHGKERKTFNSYKFICLFWHYITAILFYFYTAYRSIFFHHQINFIGIIYVFACITIAHFTASIHINLSVHITRWFFPKHFIPIVYTCNHSPFLCSISIWKSKITLITWFFEDFCPTYRMLPRHTLVLQTICNQ